MGWGGWIAVDLDGTLAQYLGTIDVVGPPIEPMVERVKRWLRDGTEVRIFTARVAESGRTNTDGQTDNSAFCAEQRALIEAWCVERLGQALPVTATKDFMMIALWDDRCVQVETNTGRILGRAHEE